MYSKNHHHYNYNYHYYYPSTMCLHTGSTRNPTTTYLPNNHP